MAPADLPGDDLPAHRPRRQERPLAAAFQRFARRAAAATAAAGVVAGILAGGVRAAPASTQELSCLTADAVQQVKRDPEGAFGALYDRCVAELRTDLGPHFADLGDDALRYAFASLVAYDMAAYGGSFVYDLRSLTRQWQLDCAGYVALTWHLARVSGASVQYAHPIGWDGAGVGNHAQLAYQRPGQELLLDPTIGLVARASFDHILGGASVPGEHMVLFAKGDDHPEFRDMVSRSLHEGAFSPAASIYLHLHPPGQGRDYAEAMTRPDNTRPAPGSEPPAEPPAEPQVGPDGPEESAGPAAGRPTAARRSPKTSRRTTRRGAPSRPGAGNGVKGKAKAPARRRMA